MNNILRNVLMRRSTTQFDSRPILDEAMIEILEEGKILSNAPSNQEWHFTVLQNRDLLRRFHVLYERLVEEKRGDAARASAQCLWRLALPQASRCLRCGSHLTSCLGRARLLPRRIRRIRRKSADLALRCSSLRRARL